MKSAPSTSAIDLATSPDFKLGEALVRPATREFMCGSSVEHLEPRVMQVLVLLSHMAGRTVSRDLMVQRPFIHRARHLALQ